MIHQHCQENDQHNWDNWFYCPADADGKKIPVSPDGLIHGKATYYWLRKCQNAGCDIVEHAEELAATGKGLVYDTKGWEKLAEKNNDSK